MKPRLLLQLALIFIVCWGPGSVHARGEYSVGELSSMDRQFMTQQRALLADLAAINLGRQFQGRSAPDLELLQTLLDRRLVLPQQTRELQAMGLIMGDLLAKELDLHWVIYEDAQGRSRALRYRETDAFLFPMTMISRRREVGNQTPVSEIYRKAYKAMAERKPGLPFQ